MTDPARRGARIFGTALFGALLAWQLLRDQRASGMPRLSLPPASTLALSAALLLSAALIVGVVVAVSGLVPIKASSGHWAITRWLLDFSSHRSVATHSISIAAPPLDDPALVVKGAGAYDVSCRFCHGSPEAGQSTLARSMTPRPPYLPPMISLWTHEQLFYLVKHGIKFTGMPAWPSQQREDEVWAMVAFLVVLPGLDAAAYRRLAGEVPHLRKTSAQSFTATERVSHLVNQQCAQCHGADGLGRETSSYPRLAGQRVEYLDRSLRAFASGSRHSGVMSPVASRLTASDMQALARYYAAQPPASTLPSPHDSAMLVRGGVIARDGLPAAGVPACAQCHGPNPYERNPVYPELSGQFADYLTLQLSLFKRQTRGGTEYAHVMQAAARSLSTDQMRDVAAYYASLPRQSTARPARPDRVAGGNLPTGTR